MTQSYEYPRTFATKNHLYMANNHFYTTKKGVLGCVL